MPKFTTEHVHDASSESGGLGLEKDVTLTNAAGILLLLFSAAVALSMFSSFGTSDVELFLGGMNRVYEKGPVEGYGQIFAYYPPGAFITLYICKLVAVYFNISDHTAFKCVVALFFLASVSLLWFISRNAAIAAAFSASVVVSAIGLGYVDIWCCPFLFLALHLLDRGYPVLGVPIFLLAAMEKWQPLILFPFLIIYAFPARGVIGVVANLKTRRYWLTVLTALLTLAPFLLFFGPEMVDSMRHSYDSGRRLLHGNAMNFPMLIGAGYQYMFDKALDMTDAQWIFPTLRTIFFMSYGGLVLAAFCNGMNREKVLLSAVGAAWAYFIISTGVHENHLAVGVFVSFYLVSRNGEYWAVAAMTSVLFNVNLILLYWTVVPRSAAAIDLAALAAVCSFVWLLTVCIRGTWRCITPANFIGVESLRRRTAAAGS